MDYFKDWIERAAAHVAEAKAQAGRDPKWVTPLTPRGLDVTMDLPRHERTGGEMGSHAEVRASKPREAGSSPAPSATPSMREALNAEPPPPEIACDPLNECVHAVSLGSDCPACSDPTSPYVPGSVRIPWPRRQVRTEMHPLGPDESAALVRRASLAGLPLAFDVPQTAHRGQETFPAHDTPGKRKQRLYIAGPMRGKPDLNFPAFHRAAAHWREEGYEVVNPAENFDGRTDLPIEEYLRQDIAALIECDAILLLAGWRESEGAQLEHAVAKAVGLSRIYEDPLSAPGAETVLQEAARIVGGSRQHHYGHPRDNHRRTAEMWSAFLGVPITARQVCMLNVLQKVSRDAAQPIRDSLVDIAGYAENAAMVEDAA